MLANTVLGRLGVKVPESEAHAHLLGYRGTNNV